MAVLVGLALITGVGDDGTQGMKSGDYWLII